MYVLFLFSMEAEDLALVARLAAGAEAILDNLGSVEFSALYNREKMQQYASGEMPRHQLILHQMIRYARQNDQIWIQIDLGGGSNK